MTMNEFSCDRPEVIFSFLIIPRRVVLKLGWRLQNHLTFLQEFLFLLLVLDAPGLRWMFSDAVFPQRF